MECPKTALCHRHHNLVGSALGPFRLGRQGPTGRQATHKDPPANQASGSLLQLKSRNKHLHGHKLWEDQERCWTPSPGARRHPGAVLEAPPCGDASADQETRARPRKILLVQICGPQGGAIGARQTLPQPEHGEAPAGKRTTSFGLARNALAWPPSRGGAAPSDARQEEKMVRGGMRQAAAPDSLALRIKTVSM
ncbi:unnamed protein product [Prorocentrum cordatum]|uniref:Uncharacterized protein n=1 Tax=Prorocentrum cordatum TaxID=2364126 RepID=A0ABN9TXU8_9DINO|nr:unnamed protein product [Polarella glacialis]